MPAAQILTVSPGQKVLDRLEELFRSGYSTHLVNDNAWTSGTCPAGHWILEQGTTLVRSDVPADELRPCLVLAEVEGDAAVHEEMQTRILWDVPVDIEVRYSRRYDTATSRALFDRMVSLLTTGINPASGSFIPAATVWTTSTLYVAMLHNVISQPELIAEGAGTVTNYRAQFTVRCAVLNA